MVACYATVVFIFTPQLLELVYLCLALDDFKTDRMLMVVQRNECHLWLMLKSDKMMFEMEDLEHTVATLSI